MNLPILVANPVGPDAYPFGVGTVQIVVVIGLIILVIVGYVRRYKNRKQKDQRSE